MKTYLLTLFFGCMAVSGCVTLDERSLTGLAVEKAAVREGTATFVLPRCPVSEEPPESTEAVQALIGVASGFAAEFITGAIEQNLQARKDALSGEFIAGGSHSSIYQAKDRLSFGCIVITRGVFGKSTDHNKSNVGEMSVANLETLNLADYPAFYLELKARLVDKSLMLEPLYLHYGASSARDAGSGKKYVSAVIALTESSPDRDEELSDEQAIALYRLYFGRLEIGKYYDHTPQEPLLTGVGAQQTVPPFEQDGAEQRIPFNITVTVAESEQPGPALNLLKTVFDSKKDDLNKALGDAILKSLVGGGAG